MIVGQVMAHHGQKMSSGPAILSSSEVSMKQKRNGKAKAAKTKAHDFDRWLGYSLVRVQSKIKFRIQRLLQSPQIQRARDCIYQSSERQQRSLRLMADGLNCLNFNNVTSHDNGPDSRPWTWLWQLPCKSQGYSIVSTVWVSVTGTDYA